MTAILHTGQSITWNGQVVRNNSLVSLSAVLQRVSAPNGKLYPLVCQGITGGQWYEPSGVLFPLATPDMVNVTLPHEVWVNEMCQKVNSCIKEVLLSSHMVFNVVPIPPSHSVLECTLISR